MKLRGENRGKYSRIESGERNILAEELDLFSNIYGVTVDEILHGKKSEVAEVTMFARIFSTLSANDKKEIVNLINFKKKLNDDDRKIKS